MPDIVVTWPKTRTLNSYLSELKGAEIHNRFIHFRVARLPQVDYGGRCYQVHDGFVRGWLTVLGFSDGSGVTDPLTHRPWPLGNYIVRHPHWNPIDPIPMKGFQGWRYWNND